MTESKFCQQCKQKHHCQDIYQQMGETKGPSVAFKAIIAFLLPILVFIVSLVIFGKILAQIIDSKQLRIVIDFILALLVTLAVTVTNRQFSKIK